MEHKPVAIQETRGRTRGVENREAGECIGASGGGALTTDMCYFSWRGAPAGGKGEGPEGWMAAAAGRVEEAAWAARSSACRPRGVGHCCSGLEGGRAALVNSTTECRKGSSLFC
jgi:hypothetical protein